MTGLTVATGLLPDGVMEDCRVPDGVEEDCSDPDGVGEALYLLLATGAGLLGLDDRKLVIDCCPDFF